MLVKRFSWGTCDTGSRSRKCVRSSALFVLGVWGITLPSFSPSGTGLLETVAHAILSPCACACTGLGAHTGRPSECSTEERYKNKGGS